jgi:NADH-quinone oxidoreductase subunit M
MSSVGLPGTNGFIGEFMILAGTFASEALQPWPRIFVLFAATGVILAAVYMLHAVLKMFWGPLSKPANQGLTDMSVRESLSLAPLVFLVFYIGFFPNTFLEKMEPSVNEFITQFQGKLMVENQDDTERLLPGPAGTEEAAPEPEATAMLAPAAEGGAR